MTESEWLTATDPQNLLDFLSDKASERKLRLFACARCRELLPMLTDERSRVAVEVGERFADGEVTRQELQAAQDKAWEAWGQAAKGHQAVTFAAISAASTNLPTENTVWDVAWDEGPDEFEQQLLQASGCKQIPFLHDIFGNPFRPVTLDPRWQSETVVALATGIYAKRAFDRMPILADALEEAGCDHADILAHCRGDGPHVRGCWVVDLLLGKE